MRRTLLLLVFCLLFTTIGLGQSSPESLPLNLYGIAIGMPLDDLYVTLGRPAAGLQVDPATGLAQATYQVQDLRLDLLFSSEATPRLKRIGVNYEKPIPLTQFGYRVESMNFDLLSQYYTYRRIVRDSQGREVLMLAMGEKRGEVLAFNIFDYSQDPLPEEPVNTQTAL